MSIFPEQKTVLIFDSKRKLVGIASSATKCADFIGSQAQSVSDACIGKHAMCQDFYVRYLHSDTEINFKEHFGVLDVIQYDKICGEERLYFPKKGGSHHQMYGTRKRTMTAEQIEILEGK